MRSRSTPLLLAVVGFVAVLLAPASPVRAAEVFVDLVPSTVEAGSGVDIRASCPSATDSARVESEAFGAVTAHRQDELLLATATVSAEARARGYPVRLSCPDGQEATTTLYVVRDIRPRLGPATGFGGGADDRGIADGLVVGGLAMVTAGVILAWRTRRKEQKG